MKYKIFLCPPDMPHLPKSFWFFWTDAESMLEAKKIVQAGMKTTSTPRKDWAIRPTPQALVVSKKQRRK